MLLADAMRKVLPSLLFILLLVPSTDAQAPTFTETYQVRAGIGDIPTTPFVESSGDWNVEQRLTVQFDNRAEGRYTFAIQSGAQVVNSSCACNPSHLEISADSATFVLERALPSGTYTLSVTTRHASGQTNAVEAWRPGGTGDSVVILFVPWGSDFTAPVEPSRKLPTTDGTATIVEFRGSTEDPLPNPFWASVHPEVTSVQTSSAPAGFSWVALAVGVVVGIALWAVLVQRGLVQSRARRQVAGVAAHETQGLESTPVLEGKKRALLAALKEIEVARQANEIPVDVYDAIKAEYKKQAVAVMRALDAVGDAGEVKT